jgi:bifunctional NMN adenylyltransferase/nudix hydrolase
MSHDFANGVYVGRFQPPHSGHLDIIRHGLKTCDQLQIVLGSHLAAPTYKNPFTTAERQALITACLSPGELQRIAFHPVRDYLYSPMTWTFSVQGVAPRDETTTLLGLYKDHSSSYLNDLSPPWEKSFPIFTPRALSATDVRKKWFEQPDGAWDTSWNDYGFKKRWVGSIDSSWKQDLPEATHPLIEAFFQTRKFQELTNQYHIVQEYKDAWKGPYPVSFTTVDAVVVRSSHVLVVKRGGDMGQGLWALPGGFVGQNETLLQAALRELKEETKIKVDKVELKKFFKGVKICDHPERSLRGRTYTFAHLFDLGQGPLPEVKGADDADEAVWMPILDVYLNWDKFFEDHASIIWSLQNGNQSTDVCF